MKVILRSDVEHVGRAGDVKSVSAGFGRNYLLPRKLAVLATEAAMKQWERGRQKRQQLAEARKKEMQALAEKLAGVSLSFSRPAGAEGKLFGSVGKSDLLKSLKASGFDLGKETLSFEPLKTVGEHEVFLKLHPEVVAKIKVTVAARE